MNIYKITATRADNGSEFSDRICEANESAARKAFKEIYRHGGSYTITRIELEEENAQASKDQERKALEQIRKIVATLGPDSYIATAFEGCFEIADANIENDWACSMKQQRDIEAKRAIDLGYEIDRLKAVLENERKRHERGVNELTQKDDERKAAIVRMEADLDALRKKILPEWLSKDLLNLLRDDANTARCHMEQAADTMAYYAEAPHDIAFQEAVASYHNAKDRREHCEQMARALAEASAKH